jgi:hypothetical protein
MPNVNEKPNRVIVNPSSRPMIISKVGAISYGTVLFGGRNKIAVKNASEKSVLKSVVKHLF